MEIICLDTDILIEYWRAKDKRTTEFFALSANYKFAVTTISAFELFKGNNVEEDLFWKSTFNQVLILPFDIAASEIAGNLSRTMRKQGRQVGVEDLLIASIAISNKMKIATNNKKHFSAIPGLKIV